MKAMAIINLIWAPVTLVLLVIAGLNEGNNSILTYFLIGMLLLFGFVHTVIFSIIVLNRPKDTISSAIAELKKLKEKGILSDEEFEAKAIELLKK